ncbi:hypothetical protein RHMOL_Rhmol04G0132300 [Rhododendron molle]|uniref:Uncharacterized protein n=1 Tax=Rhododendron molle TaxID=49168 RepID=A0ACC0P094_RHOML|nr:hypothetical protein RHMOL_Rhmol04G0132300 [Rhododendron molle]
MQLAALLLSFKWSVVSVYLENQICVEANQAQLIVAPVLIMYLYHRLHYLR